LPLSSLSPPPWHKHRSRRIITITRVITIIPTTTTLRRIQSAKADPDPDRIAAQVRLKMLA
jgi:hypothetical protein